MRADQGDAAAEFGGHLQAAVTFATTEHFNLQTARAATISEANGRAMIYLAALSSSLIALAFIGQMSRVGPAFDAFALIALPVLAFIGIVTFEPTGWQLTLTTAGMIAVVNSVVLAAFAGLLLWTLGLGSLETILAPGAIIGAAALSIQRRHQRRARDAYAPEAVDRASILVPSRPTRPLEAQ